MVATAKAKRTSRKKTTGKSKAAPREKRAASSKTKSKTKTTTKSKASAKPKTNSTKKGNAKKKSASTKAASNTATKKRSTWRKRAVRVAKWSGIATTAFIVLTFSWALTYRWVDPPRTPLMLSRAIQDGAATNFTWRDIKVIPPEMQLAVIAAEDQRFFMHRGFDFVEMRRAWEAHQGGARLRGASTLSQQTAKNVFLLPTRSWIRKGLEVYFTGLIEILWGKERILEVYLNIAETGNGLYGVEAAAQHYFGESVQDLDRQKAAAIASILPNPRERNPTMPSTTVARRQRWVLGQMENLGGDAWLAPLDR